MLLRLPSGVTAQQVRDVIRLSGAVDVLSTRVDRSAGDPAVTARFALCRARWDKRVWERCHSDHHGHSEEVRRQSGREVGLDGESSGYAIERRL